QGTTMNMMTDAAHVASHEAARAARNAGGEFLTFRLGAEEYGIDILKVQEIRSYEQPTRIANAPPSVKGVVNLRGVIVPIVDLRLKLASETAEYNSFTVLIVLNVRARAARAVVDAVAGCISVALVLFGICAVMSVVATDLSRQRIVTWVGDKSQSVSDVADAFDATSRATIQRLFSVFKQDFDTTFTHDDATGDMGTF